MSSNKVIDGSNLGYLWQKIKAAFWGKSETVEVSIDDAPTENSNNLVKSGGVASYVANAIVDASVPTPNDGTIVLTKKNNDTIVIDMNHGHTEYAAKTLVASSQPAGGMLPNVFYNLGTLTGAVTLLFASPSDNTILNEYMFCFDSGSTAAVPTWPSSITSWVGNCVDTNGDPVISASKHYEVNSVNGIAYIVEV